MEFAVNHTRAEALERRDKLFKCAMYFGSRVLSLIIGGAGVSGIKSLEWKAIVGQQRNSIADDDVDTLVHNYFMQSHY